MLDRERIAHVLLLLVLFFLPWQTRWIPLEFSLNGGVWEYGRASLYVTQVLIVITAFLRGRPRLSARAMHVALFGFMFLGGVVISTAFARHQPLSVYATWHVFTAYALLVLLLDRRTNIKQQLTAFVAGLIVPALLGWWQVLIGASPGATWFGIAQKQAATLGASVVETVHGRVLRAHGAFPHPNIFGGYLIAALFFLGFLLRATWDNVTWRTVGLLSAILLSATAVITFSRGAWLAGLAGGAVLAIWMTRNKPDARDRRILSTVALMVVAGVLISGIGFQDALTTRLGGEQRLEQQSVQERVDQYDQYGSVVKNNPVTGVGISNYTYALYQQDPTQQTWAYQPIHQFWLLLFAETGMLGTLLFIRWGATLAAPLKEVRSVAGGVAIALGSVWVTLGFFDHYLWSQWAGLALTAVIFAAIVHLSAQTTDRMSAKP